MAVKTNAMIVHFFVLCSLISFSLCVDNSVDECHCDRNSKHCYRWVNHRTCALMNGKLIVDDLCNCCPICHIRRDLLENCHQSIPGFKIRCVEPLVCSKKYGYVCIDSQQTIAKQLAKTLDVRKNPFEDKLILLVPKEQRPLKRVPRMNYKQKTMKNKYPGYRTDRLEMLGKRKKIVDNFDT